MKCPVCSNTLSQVVKRDIEVDVCQGGCGGMWFDNHEFKKFDEPHEEAGISLLDVPVDPAIQVDHDQRRPCPKCEGVTLMRHFNSVKREVEVDTCAQCGGVWLDAGELNTVRNQFSSEQEKRASAEAAFDDMFGPQLEELHKESQQKLERARRFANMFKFICPSYYIPGKQDWGAF